MRLSTLVPTLISIGAAVAQNGFLMASDCSRDQQSTITAGLFKGGEIADAALAALKDRGQTRLFEFFFKSGDRPTVTRVFTQYKTWLSHQGPPVVFHCRDFQGFCAKDPGLGAYALFDRAWPYTLKGIPEVTHFAVCPRFFEYPAAPDPCNKGTLDLIQRFPNGTTVADQGTTVLHETFHVPYIAGPTIPFIDDVDQSIDLLHSLTDPAAFGYDLSMLSAEQQLAFLPTHSAYSYSAFAMWAWIQSKQQAACSQNYPLWNAITDYKPQDRVELRKLLGVNDQPLTLLGFPDFSLSKAYCDPGCLSNLTLPTDAAAYQNVSDDGLDWTVVTGTDNQTVTSKLTSGNVTAISVPYTGNLTQGSND